MDTLKVVIVDDERAAVETLSIMLSMYCPNLSIVATASSVKEAKQVIVDYSPDVVFLDIMMSDGTGFDILEALPSRNFDIVFVTAYNHLAIKALKYSAIEFIQKPVCIDDLTKAIGKVKSSRGILRNSALQYSTLFENLEKELPSKLCLPTSTQLEVVDVQMVLAFESEDDGVVAFISDGRRIHAHKKIDHLEDTLSDSQFYRMTPTCLINLAQVEIMAKGEIFMHGGTVFNVPAERISEFKISHGNPPY